LLKKIADVEQNGMAIFFPTIAWSASAIKSSGTLMADAVGKPHTNAEMDQAIKNTIPKGWPSGAVDAVRNGDNLFTRMGTRGGAGVERTTAEKIAPWFGVRSSKEALVSQASINDRNADKQRTQALSRAAQLYTSGEGEAALKIYSKYEPNPSAAVKQIIAQAKLENTPAALRGVTGKSGSMSYEQLYKAREHRTSSLLEKLYSKEED
jgi:hypothetical protein